MAAPRYAVVWQVAPPFARRVRRRPLSALARRSLRAEGVAPPAEVSIAITDDETVRELNRRYRGIDAPTDVLSFDLSGGGFPAPQAAPLLGEVVISYPTAERQAEALGHSVEEELAHLVAHGILHLLGYDHERAKERGAMRAREEALLGFALRHGSKGRAAH